MNKLIVLLSILFSIILIAGCTSLQERGEEYLKVQAYSEAMATFEKILARDSNDQEARHGLRRAQKGWIGKTLIKVRRLRMADNYEESLDLLLEVYENQNHWQVYPKGNVAFTQEEETLWARRSILRLVHESVRDKKPLRGQYYLNRYPIFFQGQVPKKLYKKMTDAIYQLAQRECRLQIRNLKSYQYFYGRFVERFCQQWNLPPPDLALLQEKFKKETYSRVALNIDKAHGFPKTFALDLESRLQNRFKDSPWYDSSSNRVLKLKFLGRYDYKHTTRPTTLTHTYTESIPFETSRIERKSTSSNNKKSDSSLVTALKVTGFILSAIAGDFGSERRTDNGDGTVTVYETHYRDVTRSTDYSATAHLETFEAEMALQGRLNKWPVQLVRSEEGSHNSVSHQNNMSSIGLYPKSADLVGRDDWIQNERQHLSAEFGRSLKEHWRDQYCNLKRFNGQSSQQREQAFRCMEVANSQTPVGFRRWFKNKYGLELNKTIELLYHDPK